MSCLQSIYCSSSTSPPNDTRELSAVNLSTFKGGARTPRRRHTLSYKLQPSAVEAQSLYGGLVLGAHPPGGSTAASD